MSEMGAGSFLARRVGDIQGGQHTEDEGLHKAGEPVEVQPGEGRDAHRQEGDLAEQVAHGAGNQAEERAAYSSALMTVPDKMLPK